MNGALVIDKPAGMTSHDVVNRVRRITGERSVGHLGTLDPMATGVLPLLLGNMTRLAQFYTGAEKTYEGEIEFGVATDTYDADGDPVGERKSVRLELEELQRAAKDFIGIIEQVPPPFSAKKIRGVAAYKLARKKQSVDLKPVPVEVREFAVLEIRNNRAKFRARVASGTYLRSIAHDLGHRLGTGAHLASLRRTAVGEFGLEAAKGLTDLEQTFAQCPITDIMSTSKNGSCLLHPRGLLPQFPAVTAPAEALPRLLHGNAVNLPEFSKAALVKVFRDQDELVAIARRVAGTLFHPQVVLARAEAVQATAMPR
jgi:tRNA pseudouridine55 synthase